MREQQGKNTSQTSITDAAGHHHRPSTFFIDPDDRTGTRLSAYLYFCRINLKPASLALHRALVLCISPFWFHLARSSLLHGLRQRLAIIAPQHLKMEKKQIKNVN